MSEIAKVNRVTRISSDDLPPIGSWHWCKYTSDKGKKRDTEDLFCVTHIASNHVVVSTYHEGRYTTQLRYRFNEWLEHTRPAPEWRDVLQKRLADTQKELQAAVMALADVCAKAHLVAEITETPIQTLAITTHREQPDELKAKLLNIKNNEFPAGEKRVEVLTEQMVSITKALFLPERAQVDRLKKAVEKVDQRLFALELYAGLLEDVTEIRKGKPADPETPISIRQMLRYMDEETLIDFDKGGMDFGDLKQFDAWVSQDEHLNRVAPEPRCIVAFRVRRHLKDYGEVKSVWDALAQMEWHKEDMITYLLIRNGERVFRLCSEQDFEPRLIPLDDELTKPFTRDSWFTPPGGKWHEREHEEQKVTPQDFEYDDHVEKRNALMMQYNRIVFLIQGLLDRSKVFTPHPPISLANPEHLRQFVRLVRDEENNLPTFNPPNWEAYLAAKNATIQVGAMVWCGEPEEESGRYSRFDKSRPKYGYDVAKRPKICRVHRVSRDRKQVWLRWELGEKIKEERVIDRSRPHPKGPTWYYTKPLIHNLGMRYGIQKVPIEKVFAVEAYKPGEYKPFLCDPYLKGEYLEWAPQLLSAEKWHMNGRKWKTKNDD